VGVLLSKSGSKIPQLLSIKKLNKAKGQQIQNMLNQQLEKHSAGKLDLKKLERVRGFLSPKHDF
jgi:hypothetical protein